jgi:hypothetical protein
MDIAAITAVLASFGVGGLAGGWLRAEQERTERFRERMIEAAEDFLANAAEARDALARADAAASNDSEGQMNVPGSLAAAKESINKTSAAIPKLGIIFPRLGHREHLRESAENVSRALWACLAVLSEPVSDTPEEHRAKVSSAIETLDYFSGVFGGNANVQIWRRWFLHSSPVETTRFWWRRH